MFRQFQMFSIDSYVVGILLDVLRETILEDANSIWFYDGLMEVAL